MDVLTLYDAPLGGAFTATRSFLMIGEKATVDFLFAQAVGPATIEWYLEYTSDNPLLPSAVWRREVDEEDVGAGIVHMFDVVRDFTGIVGAAVGKSAQCVRAHHFIRVVMRVAAGAVGNVVVTTPFGIQPT